MPWSTSSTLPSCPLLFLCPYPYIPPALSLLPLPLRLKTAYFRVFPFYDHISNTHSVDSDLIIGKLIGYELDEHGVWQFRPCVDWKQHLPPALKSIQSRFGQFPQRIDLSGKESLKRRKSTDKHIKFLVKCASKACRVRGSVTIKWEPLRACLNECLVSCASRLEPLQSTLNLMQGSF